METLDDIARIEIENAAAANGNNPPAERDEHGRCVDPELEAMYTMTDEDFEEEIKGDF